MSQGRILSNVSFVFRAIEFQEKMLLRFTELYILIFRQQCPIGNPSIFFCERLWVSPQLETRHTKEYTNNMILKSVEKSVVFVKNFILKPRKPCHSLHTSTLNYQAENTLPQGNLSTFNLLLTFKTNHTLYSPLKSFTFFKP